MQEGSYADMFDLGGPQASLFTACHKRCMGPWMRVKWNMPTQIRQNALNRRRRTH